jgi:hypothetical protein
MKVSKCPPSRVPLLVGSFTMIALLASLSLPLSARVLTSFTSRPVVVGVPAALPTSPANPTSARTSTFSVPICRRARSRRWLTRWHPNGCPTNSGRSATRCCSRQAPMDRVPRPSIVGSAITPAWRASASHRLTSSSTDPSMYATSASAPTTPTAPVCNFATRELSRLFHSCRPRSECSGLDTLTAPSFIDWQGPRL